jgi:hypothetical protein
MLMQAARLMQQERERSEALHTMLGLLLFTLLMAVWAYLWVPPLPVF